MQNDPMQKLSSASGLGEASGKPSASSSADGAAFRALLEQLETQSQGLASSSTHMKNSAELADAVGQSEQALNQAQKISEQLLEALRAANIRPANTPTVE